MRISLANAIPTLFFSASLVLLQACIPEPKEEPKPTVERHLVGEWIYVDSGRSFYLDAFSEMDFKEKDNNLIEIPTDDNFSRFAIRSGISNSTINGSVYIPSESASASPASYQAFSAQSSGISGIAGIDVILQNIEDDSIKIVTTTDDNGNFNSDTIPTGDYAITANNENGSFKTEASISGTDTDLGIYTLNEGGEYNFKADIDIGFVYGDYQEVRGSISVHNIGTKRGDGLSYHFTCEHELIESCIIDKEPGSINPGSSKSFPVKIKLKYLTNDLEKFTIPVVIRDVNYKEWNDYVTFTAYKRFTSINIKANSSRVSGYLISPGHLPLKINTSSSTIKVPYITGEQYQLVFANTSISAETAYSVGIDTAVNDIEGFDDTGSYEPNDSVSDAIALQPLQSISSYLHIGDVDYYTIDMPADFTQAANLEFYSLVPLYDGDSYGNGDGILSKGETIRFDFAIKNSSFINVENVLVEISSEDPYISVESVRVFSLKDFASNTVTDTEGYQQSHEYFGNGNSSTNFSAAASLDTPENHSATINVTMTDKFGNQWFDTFQISIQETAANLVFNSISELFDDKDTYTDGNNDSTLNQGETARFNLAIENTGSAAAIDTLLEISTDDQYLTIGNVTDESRRVTSIQPSTIVDSNTYVKDGRYSEYFLNRSNGSGDFSATAAANTPAGHAATINLKMTDKYGNIWTDSFEITVEGIAANLVFNSISELFDDKDTYTDGNNDSTLNQGETARFNIAIENIGSSAAINALLEISTDDQYLTIENITDESRRVTSIQPSTIVDSNTYVKDGRYSEYFLGRSTTSGDFSITAAANTPTGHAATINLKMTDKFGNTWSDSFEITIEDIAANLKFHSIAELYDDSSSFTDGNNDSILNQGETARFGLAIENLGTSAAINTVLVISTDDQYIAVENTSSESNRRTTTPGSSITDSDNYPSSSEYFLGRSSGGDFFVTAAANTPVGHTATINLMMTDKFGNTWSDSFEITVAEITANLSFHSISTLSDVRGSFYTTDASGNDNGILNAGEAAHFNIAIENTGTSGAIYVIINLSADDQYIDISHRSTDSNRTVSIGSNTVRDSDRRLSTDSNFLNKVRDGGDFLVTAASDTPSGHTITINLSMTDKFGNTWNDTFTITCQ